MSNDNDNDDTRPRFSTRMMADLTGASRRQLNYWHDNWIVRAANGAAGSGNPLRWSHANVRQARAVAAITDIVSSAGSVVLTEILRAMADKAGAPTYGGEPLTLTYPATSGTITVTYTPSAED